MKCNVNATKLVLGRFDIYPDNFDLDETLMKVRNLYKFINVTVDFANCVLKYILNKCKFPKFNESVGTID